MANLAPLRLKGVPRLVFLAALSAANAATFRTSVCQLQDINAVGGKIGTGNKLAADLSPSLWTGAFGAPKIHKVRFPLWNFPLLETCLDAVIVLVSLTGTASLDAGRTAGAALQDCLDAVLQIGTIHTGAVFLAQTHVGAQKRPQPKESCPLQVHFK